MKSTKNKSFHGYEIKIKYDIQYFIFLETTLLVPKQGTTTHILLMKELVTPFPLQMASNVQQLFEDFYTQANI